MYRGILLIAVVEICVRESDWRLSKARVMREKNLSRCRQIGKDCGGCLIRSRLCVFVPPAEGKLAPAWDVIKSQSVIRDEMSERPQRAATHPHFDKTELYQTKHAEL